MKRDGCYALKVSATGRTGAEAIVAMAISALLSADRAGILDEGKLFGRARHADGPLARVDVRAALAVGEVVAVGRRRHGVRLQQRWLYVKQVATSRTRSGDTIRLVISSMHETATARRRSTICCAQGCWATSVSSRNTRLPCS